MSTKTTVITESYNVPYVDDPNVCFQVNNVSLCYHLPDYDCYTAYRLPYDANNPNIINTTCIQTESYPTGDLAIRNALRHIYTDPYFNDIDFPNALSVQKAFSLFHDELPPQEVVEALVNVGDTAKNQAQETAIGSWRYVFFTLCSSPSWRLN